MFLGLTISLTDTVLVLSHGNQHGALRICEAYMLL